MKNKGVSVIIGYVLLVVFAIVIGGGVYAWLKTYVPSETLNCPDGVSVFLQDSFFNYNYNSSHAMLRLTVKNNGRFDVAGYFVDISVNVSGRPVVFDLSQHLYDDPSQGVKFGNSVLYSTTGQNALSPGDQMVNVYYLPKGPGGSTSIVNFTNIRVIPTRFQDEDNRQRFVGCGDSRIQVVAGAGGSGSCTPSCSGKQCGSDGCGGSCGTCSSGGCNATGQCVVGGSCTGVSNPCGIMVCGNATNGTCGIVSCGICSSGGCNATGQCVVASTCGNGVLNGGEQCDDGNTANGDGCTSTCQIQSGWTCSANPTPPPASACQLIAQPSCKTTCITAGYVSGSCTNSAGNCQSGGGVYLSSGDQYCNGGSQADTCCCSISSGPIVLFSENFETYSVRYGQTLYNELNTNGWINIDNVPPVLDDDIYLNTTSVIQGTYSGLIQNDAELIGNISTIGYNNINFSYSRRTSSLESGEQFKIFWRVGNSGTWTQLEQTDGAQWQGRNWILPSTAGNKTLIQIRFFLDSNSGGNADFGYVDKVNLTGA